MTDNNLELARQHIIKTLKEAGFKIRIEDEQIIGEYLATKWVISVIVGEKE